VRVIAGYRNAVFDHGDENPLVLSWSPRSRLSHADSLVGAQSCERFAVAVQFQFGAESFTL
jgi:hypothetical protein